MKICKKVFKYALIMRSYAMLLPDMAHFEKLCTALARYDKVMQSYTQICQSHAKLWLGYVQAIHNHDNI